MTPREAATLSLNTSIKNGKYANIELSAVIDKYRFEGLDKSFFTALFYGTYEKLLTIDYIVSRFSTIEIEKIEPLVLCILRVGVYQVLFMDRVPDSAACNEAVEIAKRFCSKSSVGFVNAVMRSVARSKDKIPNMLAKCGGLEALSLCTSIPVEILESFKKDYGEDKAYKIAERFSSVLPSVTLRVNTLKTTREKLIASLGKIADKSDICESAIILSGSFPVEELFGYSEGLFFVQDIASQLCSSLISSNSVPESGTVIDVCACPGGKSFSAAINLENKSKLYSFDLHKNRLGLIESGKERLSLSCIVTNTRDARTNEEELIGSASAVICDVPCSGLGVIAKKPDIRYKPLSVSDKLPEIQYDILTAASKYLKSGGFLVYSTCTLRKCENEDIVERFLSENKGFSLFPTGILGDNIGMKTLFPDEYGTDGFFIAKIVKNQE